MIMIEGMVRFLELEGEVVRDCFAVNVDDVCVLVGVVPQGLAEGMAVRVVSKSPWPGDTEIPYCLSVGDEDGDKSFCPALGRHRHAYNLYSFLLDSHHNIVPATTVHPGNNPACAPAHFHPHLKAR